MEDYTDNPKREKLNVFKILFNTLDNKFHNKKIVFLVSTVILLILICIGSCLYAKNNQPNVTSNVNIDPLAPPKQTSTIHPAKTTSRLILPQQYPPLLYNNSGDILTGQVQKITQNLGLLLNGAPNNQTDPNVTYYEAGTYTFGQYKGFTRYIAVQQSLGPGGPQAAIFASNDGKKFILDGNPQEFTNIGKIDADWPFSSANKNKITAIAPLPTEHATIIPLDTNFALWRNSIVTINSDITKQDYLGNEISPGLLQTNFSSYSQLNSPISYLTMYQNPAPSDQTNWSLSQPSPTLEPYVSYIAGTTTTYVVDSTGLAYKYILANAQNANSYQDKLDTYIQKVNDYQTRKIQVYPDYPAVPNVKMNNTDITANASLYNSYDIALPGACAFGGDTLVAKNVSDSDFEKIGSSIDGDVYILQNKNHDLNEEEFYDKVTFEVNAGNGPTQKNGLFGSVNKGLQPPTYDQYLQKNPLLFVKDYWGRWVMLGEFDYKLLGGCGKPVVYLYPPKPTKVSIQFLSPINFDVDIPTYHVGWNVLANPDGELTDLQPQYTDCSEIDSKKFGSEYAFQACKNNDYPYLYWAGTSTNATYPVISNGWIVERSNLSTFMNNTLTTIGFNAKEKSDFLSYWMPQMLSHDGKYYRISFLQNNDMNEIAPMKVTPSPNHYYRYFLDYLPLQTKPTTTLEPENLVKIKRDGFTLIEWGGYLR